MERHVSSLRLLVPKQGLQQQILHDLTNGSHPLHGLDLDVESTI